MEAFSLQDILQLEPLFHSRKLLFFPTFNQSPKLAVTTTPPSSHDQLSRSTSLKNTLDANVIMVISVLLFALICSFCLNSIIRRALRCSSLIPSEDSSGNDPSENTGVGKQALKTFPVVNYSGDLKFPVLDTECAICLSEFASGELIRVLPECSHGFHVKCIDRWLNSHSSCPTCRHCLNETCRKIASSEPLAGSAAPLGPAQEAIVRIAPLEPEGFISNHHSYLC